MNGIIGFLCFIWGFNWVVMKLGNGAFPPVLFAAYRFGIGAIVLLMIAFYKRVSLPRRQDWKWFIVCGVLQTGYFNIAIQISLNYLSAGLTSVLTYSMPLWFAIMAHVWIPEEKLTVRKTIGVLVGILGVSLAMNIHLGGSLWALILALSSGITWAISNVIIKRKLQHCDNVQFTTWQMVAGAASLGLYSVCFEHGTAHWGILPVVYILFAGIIASAMAFLLWFDILSKTEASKASVSLLLVPVIGVISSCLVLHETLKLVTTIGIALVLIGIWIVNTKPKPLAAAAKQHVSQ